jgi:nickel-dependent lactate racemase
MVETLVASGIPLNSITILVAIGLDRPNLGEELAELIGDPWVMERVRIENHYVRSEVDHADLGWTATRGTQVKLDRRFVEADLRIATPWLVGRRACGERG